MQENITFSPFFSILIPAYNAKDYLQECIDSVLCQSFNDFEIVIVDDGSTDGSSALCDKLEQNDSRITVVHKDNQGLLMARRDGIKKAKGKYLLFLDSDDCIRRDALQLLYGIIMSQRPDVIIFRASIDKDFIQPFNDAVFRDGQMFFNESIVEVKRELCSSDKLNNMCLKCVNERIVDRDRDYSSLSFVKNGEDLIQSLAIIDNCKSIYYCSDLIYFYRQNDNSMTHKYYPSFYASIKETQHQRDCYAKKWSLGDEMLLGYSHNCALVAFYRVVSQIIKSDLSYIEKINYLRAMKNDDYFSEVIKQTNILKGNLTTKQKIVLTILKFF